MSCTAFEVTCSCTDQHLIFTDNTLTASPANTTIRVHNNCSCIHKDVQQSFLQCLSVNGLACRYHQETNILSNLFTFNNLSTYSEIFDTSIIAGTKKGFINRNSTGFLCRNYIIHKIRLCHYRAHLGQIKGIFSGINCIRITVEYSLWLTTMLSQVFHCLLIGLKNTGLCTGFYCHVAESHSVTDA